MVAATNDQSVLLEAAGRVEYSAAGGTNWAKAIVGTTFEAGARVRTFEQSRAAIQLSDRSVIRLSERTTLEILPPRRAEKRRFGLPSGSIFFFNREKPSDVEFDTPLAAGAIRGTEFLLESIERSGTNGVHLALIDGRVALQTGTGEVAMERGEDVVLETGQPPRRTALVNANLSIQWAMYYPGVLVPSDLSLTQEEQSRFRTVLARYSEGDLLGALAAWDTAAPASAAAGALRAQLELAVGNVREAEKFLVGVPETFAPKSALAELIAVVRGERFEPQAEPQTASEWMAHSWLLQERAQLPDALQAALTAAKLAPDFGFAHARVADLAFAFGNRRAALKELKKALSLSPRLASAHALQGFVYLDQGDTAAALTAFERAREIDAALGLAWLGRGLCELRERQFADARSDFQAAAALEPQRGIFRAYLGKAAAQQRDPKAAEKEFSLAKRLDPNDPTAWLYSALELWQQNRLNEAIRDLEHSEHLNDQQAPFRSRLLLEQDRAIRSANLAALFDEAGFPDVSRHTAIRSVNEDYANFSGHLFLANSYQTLEDVNRFDLRLEAPRQSELLVANLLAPQGAGNLSQLLSQQQHLQFFNPRPVGFNSQTDYDSRGDWQAANSLFGSYNVLDYAVDALYQHRNAQRGTNDLDRQQYVVTLKQRVSADDELYFQIGELTSTAGDIATYYNPHQAKLGFTVKETQDPTIYGGWHHTWSPGIHTLLLATRLEDSLRLHDPSPNLLFLRQTAGVTTEVQTPPFFSENFTNEFTLYSFELQQIFESEWQSLVVGGRFQSGDINTRATLNRVLTGVVTDQTNSTSMERESAYAYYSIRPWRPLRLIGGFSYDHLDYPENTDFPPISGREISRELVSPKAGVLFTPWERGQFHAGYGRTLGGLFFDNSIRLEPTQIGGINQSVRSLIPESVAGLVSASAFETAGIGFDQSFPGGTWFGIEADWMTSDGRRRVGTLTNSIFLPIPDSPGSTRETLDFRERDISAYAAQLLGNWFSIGARYRLAAGDLTEGFPEIPNSAGNLHLLEQQNHATLHQVTLNANLNHPSGFFAQWQSEWYHQSNEGYTPSLPESNFWQHNVYVGYRLPRRYAEARVGFLNITGRDYRLNPLNLHSDLPRNRMLTASLRMSF